MIAEDEEDCLEIYKLKGLVPKSVGFKCQSIDHNEMTPAIESIVYEAGWFVTQIVIPANITIIIQATTCDGLIQCFNGEDERMCGFKNSVTFVIGNL